MVSLRHYEAAAEHSLVPTRRDRGLFDVVRRLDARGNKAGVNAQFDPPKEKLAFELTGRGEATLPEIWPEPLPLVVETIRSFDNAIVLGENLPDVTLWT